MKNPGILTHQDLLEEYGASAEAANNMLEDKGKIFQCCSLLNVTWLTYEPFHFSRNSVSPQWASFTMSSALHTISSPLRAHARVYNCSVGWCQVTGSYEHSDKPPIAIKCKGSLSLAK